ncbi:hypothetical protein GUJ93_ZPchr0014g47351 [Zizania palustris]|uniref:Uncharacterized protein n=1 Tax=Zizania palustris TaxID=103762 RepID=A0A8J5SX23_ZIZPA|nr:hypothetical protein GUJ93_ZPchr0014g47351 [Zizania palustris]
MAVPASIIAASCLFVGASACVSPGLAFCATFAVSLVFVARELSPEDIDGAFAVVDGCLRQEARRARAALRHAARGRPVLEMLHAGAEGAARRAHASITDAVDRLKNRVVPKWTDATAAAWSWLLLAGGAINLAVAVQISKAEWRLDPTALRRRGVHGITTPTSNTEGDAASPSSSSEADATLFVFWIALTFMYGAPVFLQSAVTSGMASFAVCFACFAAFLWFTLMQAEKVYRWGSCDVGSSNMTSPRRRAGDADVSLAWESLWCENVIVTYFIDACLLCIALDSRLVSLALLAACNLATLRVARLHRQETNGSAGAIRWRGHAVAMCATGIAKVLAVCLVVDFMLGALSYAFLCSVITFLLDADAPADDDAEDAGVYMDDVAGDDDEDSEPDYVNAEDLSIHASSDNEEEECSSTPATFVHGEEEDSITYATSDHDNKEDTSTPAAVDREEEEEEDPSSSAAFDNEEDEGLTTKERSDGSDSDEHVEEQREEEPNYNAGMDDWDLVEADVVMPIDVNRGGSKKFWLRLRKKIARVRVYDSHFGP